MTRVVAHFEIPYTQLLTPDGNLNGPLPLFAEDTHTLLHLYQQMVLVRTFDKKAIALQRTGKMGTYAPINGQEAISTAIGHAMRPEDVLIPYYRDYAAQFQRGVKMSEILSYWGGDERGSQFSCNSEDLPISVPIASQTLHAAGIAFAFKYRKQARVAVVTLGDGGTSEGDFYEAINVAGAWQLPIVFIVTNNQWAISLSRHQQTHAQTLAQKAIAAGIRGLQVDGNDVIAMREVSQIALDRARNGKGPTLIEAITYRLHDHTTADDATRYRPKEEADAAWNHEPVKRLKNYILSQGWWNDAEEKQWQHECHAKVEKAVEKYFALPREPVSAMFDYHYASLPHDLVEQRETAEMFEGSNSEH